MLVDVVFVVGRVKGLKLIDVVNTDGFENEGFDEVAYVGLLGCDDIHDHTRRGAFGRGRPWRRTSTS